MVFGTLENAMRTAQLDSGQTQHKQRMQDKLDHANNWMDFRIAENAVTSPTSGNEKAVLDNAAEDIAAGLFLEEVHARTRQGRDRGFFQAKSVLRERGEAMFELWLHNKLDIAGAEQLFRMERIEGEGIMEER